MRKEKSAAGETKVRQSDNELLALKERHEEKKKRTRRLGMNDDAWRRENRATAVVNWSSARCEKKARARAYDPGWRREE
jgi:hypothetical protein